MFRPIRIRAGFTDFCSYNTLLRFVEPHGFTAVVPFVTSVEPTEASPPSPRLAQEPAAIPPRLHNCGFLRRRVDHTL